MSGGRGLYVGAFGKSEVEKKRRRKVVDTGWLRRNFNLVLTIAHDKDCIDI